VIYGKRHPSYGVVAGGTVGCRRLVIRIFTGRLYAVVTRHALRARDTVIHFRTDGKPLWRMANVALLQSQNMVEVFAARELAVVAPRTLRRQSLEYGVDVTRFATLLDVQPDEWKASGKVIEVFI
jgi:hypothetical protein